MVVWVYKEREVEMKTPMQAQYVPIVLKLHPAQIEALAAIKKQTGKSRTFLIREGVSLLIGRYVLAGKEGDNA